MEKNNKNTKVNKEIRGITLIALVVTIIVLLLLTGISISMLTGNNGILKRAGEAKEKTELSSLKEEAQMVILNRATEKTTSGKNEKTLKEDLARGINNATVESINTTEDAEGLTDVYYVCKNGEYVTVYEDGDIEEGKKEIWDGEKVSSPEFKQENNVWNWYIYTPSQLKFLADFVNNGNKFDGRDDLKKLVEDANYDIATVTMSTDTTIYLMNNLDLGGRQADGILIVGGEWTPIGIDANNVTAKLGTFEGNNNTIKGVYVNRTENFNGIFGNSNTIQNLTIEDSYIQGNACTGAITGVLISGKIEKCNNENTIIVGKGKRCGGIAGYGTGSLEKCTNRGTVSGNSLYVGGIVGAVNNNSSEIIECNNYGQVKGDEESVGGIVGYTRAINLIDMCVNTGTVKGNSSFVGGIVGRTWGCNKIKKCTNNGIVEGDLSNVGGIGGNLIHSIEECINNGKVIGKQNRTGGIAGEAGSLCTINKCINNGDIIGIGNGVGGIIGADFGIVEKSINSGKIIGKKSCIGGMVGLTGDDSDNINIKNNYNIGRIVSESNNSGSIGGIVGLAYNAETKYNYNIGEIEVIGTNVINVGGAIGIIKLGTKSNNYYLKGKANVELNDLAESKSSEEMQTEEFLSKLNENQNPAVWEYREGENNGYPVFIRNME